MNKHRITTVASQLIIAAFTATAFPSCKESETKHEVVQKKVEEPSYEVATVEEGRISADIKIPGELQAFQHVDLYAKVNSYVKQLYADVGSDVKQGQLLAIMEAPEINSQLAASQSKLRSFEAIYIASKANYDRLVETSKTPGTISPNDLDMALARQKSDYAQYQAARASYGEVINNRDYLKIKAPFTGVVSARNVSTGAYVGPSGKGSDLPMFTVQTQQKLRLVVSVPEAYTAYLNKNNEVSFTVVSRPSQVFKAKVTRMAGALDAKFRSERIEMDVPNAAKELIPGMVAEIIIPLPSKSNTLLVPAKAVVNSTEKIYVVRVNNGTAEWVPVQKGRTSEETTEVFGKLTPGDKILAVASEEIREGMPIRKTTPVAKQVD